MHQQPAPRDDEEEITLISDTDGMLWKMKLDYDERAAEIIPLIKTYHSENSDVCSETGHVIYFPASRTRNGQ